MLGRILTGILRPNKDYLFSNIIENETDLHQFIVSCSEILNNSNVRFKFSICPGDSKDWKDYIPIRNNYKDILAARTLEKTRTTDKLTFNFINGRWPSGSVVTVYELVGSSYNLITTGFTTNRVKGSITFTSANNNAIYTTIVYPSKFRIGIQILTTTNTMFPLYDLGMMYTNKL